MLDLTILYIHCLYSNKCCFKFFSYCCCEGRSVVGSAHSKSAPFIIQSTDDIKELFKAMFHDSGRVETFTWYCTIYRKITKLNDESMNQTTANSYTSTSGTGQPMRQDKMVLLAMKTHYQRPFFGHLIVKRWVKTKINETHLPQAI